MKTSLVFIISILLFTSSCKNKINKEEIKKEIYNTEKEFEKMAASKGVAEAFYYYADENATILRENILIKGKENIKNYYSKQDLKKAVVNWTPDFVSISECGTLGYTYGKYVWKIVKENGELVQYKGVFHTVWKKQKDNTWKYVWD